MSSPPSPPAAQPAEGARPPLATRRLVTASVLVALLALIGYGMLGALGEHILFERGVQLTSASVGRQTFRGGLLPVQLRFVAEGPLDANYAVFVHVLSPAGVPNGCSTSAEGAPSVPSSRWTRGQVIEQTLHVPVAAHCPLGSLEARAGLYDPRSGVRLATVDPKVGDDRVYVGESELLLLAESDELRTYSAAGLLRAERLSRLLPWLPWALGVALAAALAACFSLPGHSETSPESSAPERSARWRRLAVLLPIFAFVLGILMVLEFVKDDAYISFRYAHNLVRGEGLVFNAGEHLEGMTNFLWVLVLAPFEALGLDLFQVCELLGGALGIGCIVLVARVSVLLSEPRRDLSQLWGALWLGSSSSFALYAKSGLEQPLAAFLPLLGAFVLYRARAAATSLEHARLVRAYLGAGVLLGAGCMTRPELHLIAVLVCLPLLVDVARTRRLGRPELACGAGILAVTAPCHLFRYLYYGSLVPNTFYVKTGGDSTVWWTGLNTLRDMFQFNHTGLLVALAPLAFLERRKLAEKSAFAAICGSFLLYYMRVGVDEMHWHRLYIPALPFLCVLAGLGAHNLIALLAEATRSPRALAGSLTVVAWASVVWLAFANLRTTYEAEHGFNGHGDLAGTYHPDLGKFLVRHERPGALVAFQDMGSTPYYAPDLNFLDFFGLVDRTVAHARHDHGLHTFISGDAGAQARYDAEMRDYFFERSPEWTILTIYTPRGQEQQVAQAYERDPSGGSLGDAYRNNPVQFGLWDDPRFRQRYVPVRTWPRSAAYYLALWRRRDLWEQTPGEVVLPTPPAQASRRIASFAGGLELLGREVTPDVLERHEAFITTWWKLPGPMPRDLTFFVHVVGNGLQVPADHIPGDWMYPADRWSAGQVLEDRVLFQLPPEAMTPGDYTVYVGAYRRTTGERLAVVAGESDGQHRVRVGSLHVGALRPLLHALIPRTDVSIMRAHPERIVSPSQAVGLAR